MLSPVEKHKGEELYFLLRASTIWCRRAVPTVTASHITEHLKTVKYLRILTACWVKTYALLGRGFKATKPNTRIFFNPKPTIFYGIGV